MSTTRFSSEEGAVGMRALTQWFPRPRAAVAVMMLSAAAVLGPFTRVAHGVVRTCGSDPIANTANVLCASPSGPCTSSTVWISTPIEVTAGGCTFDLGGRAIVVDRIFDMIGTGFIKV